MLKGTPLSTQFTTTAKGEPALYISVRADENGHTHSSIFSLTSDKAKEYAFKVLHYLGYDSANDPDLLKIMDDCAVDTGKTIVSSPPATKLTKPRISPRHLSLNHSLVKERRSPLRRVLLATGVLPSSVSMMRERNFSTLCSLSIGCAVNPRCQ